MEHAKISHQNISRGIFAFVFGALLFLLLATLILETSGLEIILFLSQNEDSVNTKCKVELREVLQQVVSLHWNKCWFVQKKKKKHAPLDLVSLDFLFPFFAKEMRALDFSNLLTQLWGITGRLLQCALPADVLDLLCSGLAWDLCWAHTWGKGMGHWNPVHTDTVSGLQLCCVERLLYFWAVPHLFIQ